MMRSMFVVIGILLMLAAPVYAQDDQSFAGGSAPDFSLEDLNGKMYTLSDFQGKFVIIHFATSW